MRGSASLYNLGPGLTVQLGPFKTNANDFPKTQKKPWLGGGVPGGGQQHAGHGNWVVGMNPAIFPLQFPQPASVLHHSMYQSVVSQHDITRPSMVSAPPGLFQKPTSMIGQPVLNSSGQKATLGTSSVHRSQLQQSDKAADEMLMDDEPMHQIAPQQGQPQTLEPEQPYVDPPPLPPTVGTTSVVLHPEEVSEQHLAERGAPLFTDDADTATMALMDQSYDHFETYPHQEGIRRREEHVALERQAMVQKRDLGIALLPRLTRRNLPLPQVRAVPFDDGTGTMIVDEGGDALTPFKAEGGSRVTAGIQERQRRRKKREHDRRFPPKETKSNPPISRRDASTSHSLLQQALNTTEVAQHMDRFEAPDLPMRTETMEKPFLFRGTPGGVQKKRGLPFLDFPESKKPKNEQEVPSVLTDSAEVRVLKALAASNQRRNRSSRIGLQTGRGPRATFTLNERGKIGNITQYA